MLGQTISHYEIMEKLGEGGMGVVYKARDTHLNRWIAIKVLPPEKFADPERRRRFALEARAASALNHPNIITIYEIASENGRDFIAMEYVAGKALNQLIARKGLPLADALKCAVQIADALSAAHAAGIIHRDLKPGNVMVSTAAERSGFVKVLDFGLAKLTDQGDSSDRECTESMHYDAPVSGEGTVVGTASYMSPEQAEGKKVDTRSDIFSFGALLYEMVTGRRAFQGDSRLSTLTTVLREEPLPASQLVEGLPLELERIIARCLRKSPERRFQTMADLKVALEELKDESDSGSLRAVPPRQRGPGRRLVWAAALLAAFILGVGTLWLMRSPGKAPETLNPVPFTTYPGSQGWPSFSPDGNLVAFVWNGQRQDNDDIYVKMLGTNGPPLRLTTDAAPDCCPAWSPDGRFIAFLRILPSGKRALLLIPAIGGPERRIAEIFSRSHPTWSPDGNWLVISEREAEKEPFALSLLSVETGEKRRLTSPPNQSYGDFDPAFSPDGRSLAFSRAIDADFNGPSDLCLLTFSDGLKPAGEPRQITFGNDYAESPAWTADGREIVYAVGSSLFPRGLRRISAFGHSVVRADPQELLSLGNDASDPAISRSGHRLAYTHSFSHDSIWRVATPGPEDKRLRPGNQPAPLISSTRNDESPQFSPDGKKCAFTSARSGSLEIWISDADGSNALQLTSFGGPELSTPRWSPNGEHIAFDSDAPGEWDIYVVGVNGGKPQRMTTDPANDGNPSWSQDGQWIYFDSARAGEQQVWKMPANGGAAVQVTKDGGFAPLESQDGKFVYYTKALFSTSLWKIPIGGGEPSKVLEGLSAYQNVAIVSSGIYFVPTRKATGESLIQFVSFATNQISTIATLAKSPVWGITVSPDGKWIVFGLEQQAGSELMLVDNFR